MHLYTCLPLEGFYCPRLLSLYTVCTLNLLRKHYILNTSESQLEYWSCARAMHNLSDDHFKNASSN